ncbi:MAG: ABC transporter permease subunit [Bradyrhizobium sp.]
MPLVGFAAVAFVLPVVLSGNRYLAFVAGVTLIHVLWACGMNLLYGYTGLMPLMFAGIAGISAYTVVDLTATGWSFWLALPVGALAASVAGTILGLPSLRLKGFYFTLCSLVIQTVMTLGCVSARGPVYDRHGVTRTLLNEINKLKGSLWRR